jgi:chromosome condensin MukBEF complex kleisin-like MukF subunit
MTKGIMEVDYPNQSGSAIKKTTKIKTKRLVGMRTRTSGNYRKPANKVKVIKSTQSLQSRVKKNIKKQIGGDIKKTIKTRISTKKKMLSRTSGRRKTSKHHTIKVNKSAQSLQSKVKKNIKGQIGGVMKKTVKTTVSRKKKMLSRTSGRRKTSKRKS